MNEDIFKSIRRLVLDGRTDGMMVPAARLQHAAATVEIAGANDPGQLGRIHVVEPDAPVAQVQETFAEAENLKEPDMPSTVAELPQKAAANEQIMSAGAAAAAHNAFAALSQLQIRSSEGEENTLQGLVSDLLRPMLREWLDRELKTMVENRVDAEVRRIAGHL